MIICISSYLGLLLSAAVSPSKKIMDVGYNVAEISKVQHALRHLW